MIITILWLYYSIIYVSYMAANVKCKIRPCNAKHDKNNNVSQQHVQPNHPQINPTNTTHLTKLKYFTNLDFPEISWNNGISALTFHHHLGTQVVCGRAHNLTKPNEETENGPHLASYISLALHCSTSTILTRLDCPRVLGKPSSNCFFPEIYHLQMETSTCHMCFSAKMCGSPNLSIFCISVNPSMQNQHSLHSYNFSWDRDIHFLENSLGDDCILPTWNPRAKFMTSYFHSLIFGEQLQYHNLPSPHHSFRKCLSYICHPKNCVRYCKPFPEWTQTFPVVHLGRRPEAPNHHGT